MSTSISRWAETGEFVKYIGVYGKTTTDVTTTTASTTDVRDTYPQPEYIALPISSHNHGNVTFQRSSLIFGGTINHPLGPT